MSTATLPAGAPAAAPPAMPPAVSPGRGHTYGLMFGQAPGYACYKKDSGAFVVERAAVFRSGTFRDSSGTQATYEKLHIKQLITNYKHLRDNKIFADIPVRDGHKGWLIHDLPGNGEVIGWHREIWDEELEAPHDGVKYDYVLANLDITEPEAGLKIERGTWRNRSAEIHTYRTNDEAEFWPVYMGVAYVDIPAVEGLRFSASTSGEPTRVFVFMDSRETGVTTSSSAAAAAGQAAPTQPAQPAPVLGAPASTPAPQPVSFSLFGQTVTDPVRVQQHITTLEQFQSETVSIGRENFVKGLAASNKILATQVEGLVAFAKGLNSDQFEQFKKNYEVAPTQPAVSNHSAGSANGASPSDAAQAGQTAEGTTEAQVITDLETVKLHTRTGSMSKEQIEKTASYQRLKAAGKAPALR